MSPLRVLTYTSLYPNAVRPRHGLFVARRVEHVAATGRVHVDVVAPVPWFPLRMAVFGEYARHAAVPPRETRAGLEVLHPRYLVIPKIGMRWTPGAMARATRRLVERMHATAPIDVLDAHYLYPDGVAAAALGQALGIPFVLTARGSDVNTIPHVSRHAKDAIVAACAAAARVVTVSEALRDGLVELGVAIDRITVIRNGVDRELFSPAPGAAKQPSSSIASVGNLIDSKGHHLVIDALAQLEQVTLRVCGDGPRRAALERRARDRGVAERVSFEGSLDPTRLRDVYRAVDATVLASEMEGLPNVVNESLACGTPVVATRVGGIPEAMRDSACGTLLADRSPAAIARAVAALLADPPAPDAVRATTADLDWTRCAASVVEVFERAVSP